MKTRKLENFKSKRGQQLLQSLYLTALAIDMAQLYPRSGKKGALGGEFQKLVLVRPPTKPEPLTSHPQPETRKAASRPISFSGYG